MEAIQNFIQTLTGMQLSDYLDIIVVAFLIYKLLPLIKSPGTMKIVRFVLIVVLLGWVTDEMKLHTISWIINQFLAIGLLAFVVLFQPELRQMMFLLVGTKWFGGSKPVKEMERIIDNTVEACGIMSLGKKLFNEKKAAGKADKSLDKAKDDHKEKTENKDLLMDGKVGALIVFERKVPLTEWIEHGTPMNCEISTKTLCSIFYPVAPLHDGAVIIRNGKIAAAGCKLPLTKNENYTKNFGTRHCAAVGITEASDAIAIVVSEERGEISYAHNHMLTKCIEGKLSASEMLAEFLRKELLPQDDSEDARDLIVKIKSILGQGKENGYGKEDAER